ncbi:MAG: PAS domain S-box protein [Azonexus sp.]|nr:PAS domain S-box protein [Betaproteobacteria bacterium]MBK8919090.1 PAS domain S-box protein [Betaproteobacteria bacterium]MBP6036588.1 PAS domain S-box protein [Azonexus sp.]MBP6907197.1 PAS domain S-box protein [Azonexus sp.]
MASTIPDSPSENRILAGLAPADLARLSDDLEPVTLAPGTRLYGLGDVIEHVYFPLSGLVSLACVTAVGQEAELAVTGREGLVGICLVLGGDRATYQVSVCDAGEAYRLKADVMAWELGQGGPLLGLCLRYARLLMQQMAQAALCCRHHSPQQQVSRWLLSHLDRLGGSTIARTQAGIAEALGLRRAEVNACLGQLHAGGILLSRRGRITVTDRDALAARACDCYAPLRQEEDRQAPPRAEPRAAAAARPGGKSLRQRAEARWQRDRSLLANPPGDAARLVHELQVHQIELEMHNEELQRARDEAEALRRRCADIHDFSPVGYFTLDARGTILDLNLAGAILLGIKRSEASRRRFVAALAPSSLAPFEHLLAAVLASGAKQVGEFTLLPTHARPETVVRVEAVADETGGECRLVAIDVTPARRAEEALRQREQYQRALLDNFPFMVWLKDEDSRFLAVNTPLARNFGYATADELIGRTDFDITTREMAEAYRADDRAVLLSGEQKLVEELIEADGSPHWFETYKSPLVIDGRRVGTVGFARDVSHRHFIQAALEDAERRHRRFIDQLSLPVAVVQDGALRHVNAAALELLGYAPQACLEQPFLPRVHEADRPRVQTLCAQAPDGEAAPRHCDLRVVAEDGRWVDCRVHVSFVDWGGRPAALGILEDLTQARRLQAELHALAASVARAEASPCRAEVGGRGAEEAGAATADPAAAPAAIATKPRRS